MWKILLFWKVLWLPIKDTCLPTGSTGRESGSKEKKHTSQDRHWRPGRNRRCSCESQEVHGAVLLQLLLLCGQWRILLCMGARSFPRTGSLCVQRRLENPILRETKSHIWLAVTDGLQLPGWALSSLRGALTLAERKVFLITPELSRSFDPSLPACHKSGEMLFCEWETGWTLEPLCWFVIPAKLLHPFSTELMLMSLTHWFSKQEKDWKQNGISLQALKAEKWSSYLCQCLAAASWEVVSMLHKCCLVAVAVFG